MVQTLLTLQKTQENRNTNCRKNQLKYESSNNRNIREHRTLSTRPNAAAHVSVCASDVVNQESVERSVEEVGQLVGEEGLNCLINNAGINVIADLHSATAEKMIENFHTNAVAPLMVTQVTNVTV